MRAKDSLGNTDPTPASYTWTITPASTSYTFVGFFQPVDNPPVINTVNSGQSIPQKWQLFDAATGQPVSDPTSFVSFTSYQVSCTTWSGNPASAIAEDAPGASGLQYQGNGNWQFNWKTDKGFAKTCRTAVLKLKDGSTHTANFNFTK